MQSVARYFGETWTLGKGRRIVVITNRVAEAVNG
jgi:hypothetical protein